MAPINLHELRPVPAHDAVSRAAFDDQIRPAGKPAVLRGAVTDWPAVKAAATSDEDLEKYLVGLSSGKPAQAFIASPSVQGRYFYNGDMSGFNFDKREIPVHLIIEKLLYIRGDENPLGVYAGAVPSSALFPAFSAQNPMPLLDGSVDPKVWISNASQVAPHFDTSENIAAVVTGRRSFILFPPEQISNLYVGPIDHTMAGQPASMVDLNDIDFERFPRMKEALAAAMVAELTPGDAVYIPSLWWHGVHAHDPFNVLVNYWWADGTAGSPMNALALALLLIRELPPHERSAWRTFFDHYIFGEEADDVLGHVPAQCRGVLGAQSPARDAMIKNFLRAQLPSVLR